MTKLVLLTMAALLSLASFASEHQMIDTLGSSPKGQFVALEEYGYNTAQNSYYVKIKIMNVWKKEYVGKSFEVDIPAHEPENLDRARLDAKVQATDELKKFDISV